MHMLWNESPHVLRIVLPVPLMGASSHSSCIRNYFPSLQWCYHTTLQVPFPQSGYERQEGVIPPWHLSFWFWSTLCHLDLEAALLCQAKCLMDVDFSSFTYSPLALRHYPCVLARGQGYILISSGTCTKYVPRERSSMNSHQGRYMGCRHWATLQYSAELWIPT